MSQFRNFSENHNHISFCLSCLVIQSVCYFHSKLDHRLLSAEETSIVQLQIDRQLPLHLAQRRRDVVAVLCVLIIGYLRAFDWTVVLPYRMEIENDSTLMRTIQMSVEKLCHFSQLLEVQVTSRWWWNQLLLRLKRPNFLSIPSVCIHMTREEFPCVYIKAIKLLRPRVCFHIFRLLGFCQFCDVLLLPPSSLDIDSNLRRNHIQ